MGRTSKRVPEFVVKHHFYNNTQRVLKWIQEYRDRFAVGDIVNLTHLNKCRVTYKDGCLKRYKVVFIDEMGMAYVRQIAKRRGYVKDSTQPLYNLTQYNEASHAYLAFWHGQDYAGKIIGGAELDEGYVNSVMLGERFDPRSEYKARRGIIHAPK
jgi:hypothetical protein